MHQSTIRSRRSPKGVSGLVAEGNVLVRGEGIYHQTGGTPEAGAHTVIYLHGAGGGSSWWVDLLASSCDSAYSVAVDLPGHGKSSGNGTMEVNDYVEWLGSFLDTLALRQELVLVGSCLGGLIGLEFARLYPERVLGLVLCGVPGGKRISPEELQSAAKGDDLAGYVPSLFSASASPALRDRVLRQWLKTRPEVRYQDLKACEEYGSDRSAWPLPVPTLLMVGSDDRFASPKNTIDWASKTGADVAWIHGAGFLCMLEKPEAFRARLCGFLQTLQVPAIPELPRAAVGGYRRTVF